MRRMPILLGVLVVTIACGTAFGQTEIEKAPLTWQQAALGDGEELYVELCAVCHGAGGKGDGPAAIALKAPVPDLTMLATNNAGVYPSGEVEKAITGESEILSHGTLDMPIWGRAFADVRPDVKPVRREAFAKQRIYNLTTYLESLQQTE